MSKAGRVRLEVTNDRSTISYRGDPRETDMTVLELSTVPVATAADGKNHGCERL